RTGRAAKEFGPRPGGDVQFDLARAVDSGMEKLRPCLGRIAVRRTSRMDSLAWDSIFCRCRWSGSADGPADGPGGADGAAGFVEYRGERASLFFAHPFPAGRIVRHVHR